MLVYEDDSDILPRLRILLKHILNLSRIGLAVNDEEVPLWRWAGGHMLRGLEVSRDVAPFGAPFIVLISRPGTGGRREVVRLCPRGGDR